MTKTQRLRAVILMTMLASGVAAAVASPVFADDALPTPGADSAAYTISAPIVTLLIGAAIPLLNGLVTKISTSSKVKATITIVLNAVSAAVTTAIVAGGDAVFSNQTVLTFFVGLFTSISTYYGGWKPFGLSSSTPGPMSGPGLSDAAKV